MNYRNPQAQYHLGKIFFKGKGKGEKFYTSHDSFNSQQKKGNPFVQTMLGNMFLQEGKIICGMAMLTAAYKKANVKDRNWIRLLLFVMNLRDVQ
ncbi:hypothetical protein [Bartonella sp. TT110JLCBS]|uniref:hypothetical protein n=1 Tax=Bartonella sp. TT110JLCBS TaxID=3243578 RepID=UPI0035D11F01